MNRALLSLVVVTSLGIHAPAVLAQTEEVGLPALGKRFVDALEDDNLVAYAQCWVAGPIYRDVGASVDRLTEEDLADMKTRHAKRDRFIAASFKPLHAELDKLVGAKSRLSLEEVLTEDFESHRTKYGNIVREIRVALIVRIDADTFVRLDMNRAIEIGRMWYFVNTPPTSMSVIDVDYAKGERSSRSIHFDFATEDEAAPF